MNILWMSWKDPSHPQAGGAEVVQSQLAKRLAADGHTVKIITTQYPGAPEETESYGYKILRKGGRFTVYWQAYRRYKKTLHDWPDVVIDEMNTIPFFARFYARKHSVLLVHQLARKIWFYEMFFPLSLIGYLLEPAYLWLLRKQRVITVSESTKQDLMRYGFAESNISIISEGIEFEPVKNPMKNTRFEAPTLLSFGSIRGMKRTLDQLKAFELAKNSIPDLRLVIAGSMNGSYGKRVKEYAEQSEYSDDIKLYGRVSEEQKINLMRKSHVFLAASVKEGWCIVVTEAGSQGTPSVVYDVDGLRDSVIHQKTGLVTEPDPESMAYGIVKLLSNQGRYETYVAEAWSFAKTITFDASYSDLKKVIAHE